MTGRDEIETALDGLAADDALAGLLRSGAPVLVWAVSGERLLWTSPAAAGLRGLADPAGRPGSGPPARARLKALGSGLAPRAGVRLERIPLDPRRLAPPTICACRLLTLPSGEEVLATAVVGPVPKIGHATPESTAGDAPGPSAPVPAAFPAEPRSDRDAAALSRLAGRGSLRFVWEAGPDGRVAHVSDLLAEAVGPAAGAMAGRAFAELAGEAFVDTRGDLLARLARGDTFSGHPLLWRLDGTDLGVRVDLAGMAVRGPDGSVRGFRGFGLVRADALAPWPAQAGAPAPSTAEPSPHAATAAEPPVPAEASPAGAGEDIAPVADGLSDADKTGPGSVVAPPAAPAAAAAPGSEEADAAGASAPDSAAEPASSAPLLAIPPAPPAAPAAEPASSEPASSEPASSDPLSSEPPSVRDEGQPAGPRAPEPPAEERRPAPVSRLSVSERSAFREIARALGARFEGEERPEPAVAPAPAAPARPAPTAPPAPGEIRRVLDALPLGVLVHRGEEVLHANPALLDLADYASLDALVAAGGLARLFQGRAVPSGRPDDGAPPTALATARQGAVPVEVRFAAIDWERRPASLIVVRRLPDADPAQRLKALELELRARDARIRELSAILDTATDGVIILDEAGRVVALNRSAEALFGYEQNEVVGEPLVALLAPESHAEALAYLGGLREDAVASLLNDGREVLGRVRQGGVIPLFMTLGRVTEGQEARFCAVLRDVTAMRKAESEIAAAKRTAEAGHERRADFLAKVSHEVRTPLNAIIGFTEVMLEGRFGPIGNERYGDYLRDIHDAGVRVVRLVTDLVDLAKVEAGRMELAFASLDLNALVAARVGGLQPQAARDRIVVRTSLAPRLPPVLADERSVGQIVENVVSNAIKFTAAGGQVIVSTAVTDRGEVAFRVRDTGVGMTAEEVEAALEPFHKLATARKGGGSGLGLPLTKALVEANRGAFQISSAPNEGTLIEILFRATRVAAQ